MNLSGKHIIGFEEVKSSDTFTVSNPATGVVLDGEFSNGGGEAVESAAQLAESIRKLSQARVTPQEKDALTNLLLFLSTRLVE